MPHERTKDLTARQPKDEVGLPVQLVADASRAPVLRDQGSIRPAGHGKADAGVEGNRGYLSVTCGPDVADATCTLSAAVRGGLLAPEERAVA